MPRLLGTTKPGVGYAVASDFPSRDPKQSDGLLVLHSRGSTLELQLAGELVPPMSCNFSSELEVEWLK